MHQATDRRFVDAPKALLHDHLDGGVRAETIVEISEQVGHEPARRDAEGLDRWFIDAPTPAASSAIWRRSSTPSR